MEIQLLPTGEGQACCVGIDRRVIGLDRVAAFVRERRPEEVLILGSVEVPYRCMAELISTLRQAGLPRIGFVSEPAAKE